MHSNIQLSIRTVFDQRLVSVQSLFYTGWPVATLQPSHLPGLPCANIGGSGFHCFSDIPLSVCSNLTWPRQDPGEPLDWEELFPHNIWASSLLSKSAPLHPHGGLPLSTTAGSLICPARLSEEAEPVGGRECRRCGVQRETARGATCPTALPHHQPPPCSAPGP